MKKSKPKKKSKNIWPKRDALISIQLWKNKSGDDCVGLTTKKNKIEWNSLNAHRFGEWLAKNELLDEFDIEFLEKIFISFLRETGVVEGCKFVFKTKEKTKPMCPSACNKNVKLPKSWGKVNEGKFFDLIEGNLKT